MSTLQQRAQAAHQKGALVAWAYRHLPCPGPVNVFERDWNVYAINQARYFPETYLANLTPDGWRPDGRIRPGR